jgi:hypothetical protein
LEMDHPASVKPSEGGSPAQTLTTTL